MDFITNPDGFLGRKVNASFKLPLLIVLLAAAISSLSAYLLAPAIVENLREKLSEFPALTKKEVEAIVTFTYYSTIIAPIISTFVSWFVLSAILYVISAVFGGKGRFSDLAKLVAYSYIPVIILSPVSLYISIESLPHILHGSKSYSNAIFGVAVTAWQSVYWTFAVKNARGLDLKKSAASAAIVFILSLLLTSLSLIFSSPSVTP